jgi:hypothetical protein
MSHYLPIKVVGLIHVDTKHFGWLDPHEPKNIHWLAMIVEILV